MRTKKKFYSGKNRKFTLLFRPSVVQNTKERCESAFFNTRKYTLGKNEHPNSLYKCSRNARTYRLWREKKEKIARHLAYVCGVSFSDADSFSKRRLSRATRYVSKYYDSLNNFILKEIKV